MRHALLCLSALAIPLVACGGATTSYVRSEATTLGRVVVYRNGVAYFERTARVDDDKLTLAVPADKIDDFLKSLSVVDARTGEPTPVSYPTTPGAETTGTGLVDMKIELPGHRPHDLRLSYVTEAPAWKPSYRVVLGEDKKVDLTGSAIVDNTSGEDWKDVRLGVGASSALSFRFDLRSVRIVERETLQSNDLFAFAPPTGEATYGGPPIVANKVIGDVSDETLTPDDSKDEPLAAGGFGPGDARITARTAPAAGPGRGHGNGLTVKSGGVDSVVGMRRKVGSSVYHSRVKLFPCAWRNATKASKSMGRTVPSVPQSCKVFHECEPHRTSGLPRASSK